MFLYESVLLFDPNLEEDKIDELLEKHSRFISKHKGEIVALDKWGKRSLAYEINDFTRAYYVLLTFRSKPQNISLIERQYRLTEPIIRYLTVKKKLVKPSQAAVSTAVPQEENSHGQLQ